jgi:DNA invertase Pin-like site-specific DNA recombinase
MAHKTLKQTMAYLRTSSAANIGAGKDSDKRQRAAIEAFAKAAGFEIAEWFALTYEGPLLGQWISTR